MQWSEESLGEGEACDLRKRQEFAWLRAMIGRELRGLSKFIVEKKK